MTNITDKNEHLPTTIITPEELEKHKINKDILYNLYTTFLKDNWKLYILYLITFISLPLPRKTRKKRCD